MRRTVMPSPTGLTATCLCVCLLGCDEPQRVAAPVLAPVPTASHPRQLDPPALPPIPAAPPLPAPPLDDLAPPEPDSPKPAVRVELVNIQANVDPEQIRRLMQRLATDCHTRAPTLAGTMTLRFALTGNYAGPELPQIRTTPGLGRLNACMRREMAAARWPTGQICGTGLFEIRVRFTR